MQSTFDRASFAVASAAAIASNFVKIVSAAPLRTIPENLFLCTFKTVGIIDDAHIAVFRTALLSLVPDTVKSGVQSMQLNPSLMIGLVVNHLDALIAQSEG